MHIAYAALAGGALIGGAATMLLACNGTYAGSLDERSWRLLFLLGLVGAAAVAFLWFPDSSPHRQTFPRVALVAAGVLVGFGTRLGNGRTNGHGVCGLGRLSLRSLAAVLMFVTAAMVTVALTRHVWMLSQ